MLGAKKMPGGGNYAAHTDDVVQKIQAKYRYFSRQHVERALCETGHKRIDVVTQWLLAHRYGGDFDSLSLEREYIVFLCPTGQLLSEISKFYEQSFAKCGSNAAHNLFPHITMTSFFKVGDSMLGHLLDIFEATVVEMLAKQPSRELKLHLQRSDSYIGMFMDDVATTGIAHTVHTAANRVKEKLGISIQPQDKKHHLTLAYNFKPEHTSQLESLARKLNLEVPARWELNIYSRDQRSTGKTIRVALQTYDHPDHLQLKEGDHVIMTSSDQSKNGLREGRSFESGKEGYFAEQSTKKTAEWRIWTKNLSLAVFKNGDSKGRKSSGEGASSQKNPARRSHSLNLKKRHDSKKVKEQVSPRTTELSQVNSSPQPRPQLDRMASVGEIRETRQYASTSQEVLKEGYPEKDYPGGSDSNRSMFFMRHAERVDLTFGHDWFHTYIDEKGYHRRNLNLPRRIPTRRGGPHDFFMDGPITEIGSFQSRLVGEAMRAKGVVISHVFSSPSLRSVQTAHSVLEGLGALDVVIKVEPSLFEWMAWCRNTMPKFMTPLELEDYGIHVDTQYTAFIDTSQFNLHEKTDEYYFRSHAFVDHVSRSCHGNVLMVGHSATLDVCTRLLTEQPIRKTDELIKVVQKVPFCGLCMAEQHPNLRWTLSQAPIPSLAHGQNQAFDWRVLINT